VGWGCGLSVAVIVQRGRFVKIEETAGNANQILPRGIGLPKREIRTRPDSLTMAADWGSLRSSEMFALASDQDSFRDLLANVVE
jgi:hypothetical protein